MGKHAEWDEAPGELLRAGRDFVLADLDRDATPGWSEGKAAAEKAMAARGEELSDLQERLFADGRTGGDRSVLLVLQGLDTAGKGGIVRHVLGMLDPQGVALASFGVPTAEERKHHHLWRIRRALPPAGKIGVFDRSHYEQVLVVKVDGLEPAEENEGRYAELNRFDRQVVNAGTTLIKVALMVSYEEQGARLRERLERDDKHWKYNPGDVDTRLKWDEFQGAYQEMFTRTSTEAAPWYVVPADHKWYARIAVTELLYRALSDLDLSWPTADFDVEKEKARLAATMSEPGYQAHEHQDTDGGRGGGGGGGTGSKEKDKKGKKGKKGKKKK
ncbi:polyphosphate kinase 2 family protein [Occultella glacieicola]|uniref:Polyphosphate kinase 2 family protein n=1 Tax=Occultella glacieicola TaxID=2518684 RepID=A0ABY2E3Z5_9MICO|nr:PPK2 family polyphosphate kinase [Occultella glacieicola]TDE93933.1 polyphosphate kinase 2 family protein [Occultella glacieicola]